MSWLETSMGALAADGAVASSGAVLAVTSTLLTVDTTDNVNSTYGSAAGDHLDGLTQNRETWALHFQRIFSEGDGADDECALRIRLGSLFPSPCRLQGNRRLGKHRPSGILDCAS